MKNWTLEATMLALLASPAAFAADPGPYVGAGVGYADVLTDDEKDDLRNVLRAQGFNGNVDDDTENFNFRVFGGYQLTPNFGVELAYLTLGDLDLLATVTAPVNGTVKAESDIDGFEFVATGAYPIYKDLDLTARIGGIYYNAGGDVSGTGPLGAANRYSVEDDGVAFTGGVGFAREFGTRWTWRGGWQYVDTELVENLFQTSLAYSFGN